jgi:hypothetical protein
MGTIREEIEGETIVETIAERRDIAIIRNAEVVITSA